MTFTASYQYRLRDRMTPEIQRIQKANQRFSKGFVDEAKRMSASFNRVGQGFTDVGKKMTVAGASTTAPLGLMTREAMKFNKGVAELSTLMPDKELAQVREEMNDTLLSISRDFGTASDDVVKSAYQAVSAGIAPTKEAVDEFLRVASEASIGGVTTLETAVDGMTSVMNAYRSQGLSATQISDEMFTAVRLGKTTFEELSASLFNVVPSASALGIKFGEVTSALATMTAQGVPTNVATTQLRAMFVELGREGTKVSERFKRLSGKSFPDFIKEGGSVGEALNMIQKHAERNNMKMMDMFSNVRAGQGAMALAGENAEAFAKALEETENASGATGKAFKKMAEDDSFKFEQAMAGLRTTVIELGATMIPIVTAIAKSISGVVKVLSPWIKENQKLVGTVLMVALALGMALTTFGSMIFMAGVIIKGIGSLIGAFGALKVAFTVMSGAIAKASIFLVTNPFGAILLAVAGVALAVWQIYKNWDIIVQGLTNLWKGWSEFIVNTIHRTAEYWGEKIFNMVQWFRQVGETISGIWKSVVGFFKTAFLGYVMFLKSRGEFVKAIFGKVWEFISGAFVRTWDFIKNSFSGYLSAIFGAGAKIGEFFSGVWEGIKTSFHAVWENIKSIFVDGIKFLTDLLPDFIKDRLGIGGEIKVIEQSKMIEEFKTMESVQKAGDLFSEKGISSAMAQSVGTVGQSMPESREVDVNVKNDVGGTLKIEIDSKGKAKVRESSSNGNLGYQVG